MHTVKRRASFPEERLRNIQYQKTRTLYIMGTVLVLSASLRRADCLGPELVSAAPLISCWILSDVHRCLTPTGRPSRTYKAMSKVVGGISS